VEITGVVWFYRLDHLSNTHSPVVIKSAEIRQSTMSVTAAHRCETSIISRHSPQVAADYVLSCVCLSSIYLCKQDISKSYLWIFAKCIADTPYILPRKIINFGADHIQDVWELMHLRFMLYAWLCARYKFSYYYYY